MRLQMSALLLGRSSVFIDLERTCWVSVTPLLDFHECKTNYCVWRKSYHAVWPCASLSAFQYLHWLDFEWRCDVLYSYVRCAFKWRCAVFRWHLTMFRFCVFMSSGCLVCLMCVVALRHFYCIVLADISRRLLASHETVPNDKKVVALDDRRRATLLDLLLTFKFLAIITCSTANSWGENDFRSQIQQKNLMCA